jgi:methionyl-tRNA synthetase
LANTIGNLLNRTSSMARRWFAEAVPPAQAARLDSHPLALLAAEARDQAFAGMDELDFRRACEAALGLAISANGFLNEQAPWSRMKQEGSRAQVGDDLYAVLEAARQVALLLLPLLPDLSQRLLSQLAQEPPLPGTWQEALSWGGLDPGASLPEPSPVMARLELDSPL